MIDLANWITELTGNEARVVFKLRRDWDEVMKRRASIKKARKILGYEPKPILERVYSRRMSGF